MLRGLQGKPGRLAKRSSGVLKISFISDALGIAFSCRPLCRRCQPAVAELIKFEFVINLKGPRALGLPLTLLVTEVIDNDPFCAA